MNLKKLYDQDLNFLEVEKNISHREGSYAGLQQEALLTSSADYRSIFMAIPRASHYLELGSGYGVGPLIYHHLYPDSHATGIEFEFARFEASILLRDQLKFNRVDFIHADLLTCELPQADLYFLYFPTGHVLDRILYLLGTRLTSFLLIAIESHGDLFARLEQEVWLSVEMEIPLESQRHSPCARVYRKHAVKERSFHDYSFQDLYFQIKRTDGQVWIGDSFGMAWIENDTFNLLQPPATFCQKDVIGVYSMAEFDEKIQLLLKLRRLGCLEFFKGNMRFEGFMRKIFIHPQPVIELSTGELIELDDNCLKTLATTYCERLKSF